MSYFILLFTFLFRADSGEEKIVSLEMELKVVGENMKQMEVKYPYINLKGRVSPLFISPYKFLDYFGLCFRFVVRTTMDKI
jgi:hypothetical protein